MYSKINYLFFLSFFLMLNQIHSMEDLSKVSLSSGDSEKNQDSETSLLSASLSGKISLGQSYVVLNSPYPNAQITLGGSMPTAYIKKGTGFTVGAVSGMGHSADIQGAARNNTKYNFSCNLHIPVLFTQPYVEPPVVIASLEHAAQNNGMLEAVSNTATNLGVTFSNVTSSGVTVNITFNILAQGEEYLQALSYAESAINSIMGKGLSVNFIAE